MLPAQWKRTRHDSTQAPQRSRKTTELYTTQTITHQGPTYADKRIHATDRMEKYSRQRENVLLRGGHTRNNDSPAKYSPACRALVSPTLAVWHACLCLSVTISTMMCHCSSLPFATYSGVPPLLLRPRGIRSHSATIAWGVARRLCFPE